MMTQIYPFDYCIIKLSTGQSWYNICMSITRINNIFSKKEIDHINKIISESPTIIDNELGRIQVRDLETLLLPETIEKLKEIGKPLEMGSAMSVEYSLLYGNPELNPHFDGDTNDLIVSIQLESNTVWDIGLNLETYKLEDNCALIFNANKEIHWRVLKHFKEGEYVRMMFVRFLNPDNLSDYSHLAIPNNPMLDEAYRFRDSLGFIS